MSSLKGIGSIPAGEDHGMDTAALNRPSISVILPTYNEKDNIVPLVEQTFQALGDRAEVIVVDDDSPDGTGAAVEQLTGRFGRLRLLRRTSERGLVSALQAGIDLAAADVVAWMDCDLSMPPALLAAFLGKIGEGYDMVFGSRFVPGGGVEIITGSKDSASAYFMSRLLNGFIRAWLGDEVSDYTSGFVAVRKQVVQETGLRGDYGEYFIALAHLARKSGYRLLEVPYVSLSRRMGTSKTGTNIFQYLRRGRKYLWLTLKIRFARLKQGQGR
jgi:dolichol-phosphate mannosyltransferase